MWKSKHVNIYEHSESSWGHELPRGREGGTGGGIEAGAEKGGLPEPEGMGLGRPLPFGLKALVEARW